MKTNRKMPAVIRAPRDAGDNIPNMAKTAKIVSIMKLKKLIQNIQVIKGCTTFKMN